MEQTLKLPVVFTSQTSTPIKENITFLLNTCNTQKKIDNIHD
jgi:hypothetical protein